MNMQEVDKLHGVMMKMASTQFKEKGLIWKESI